MSLSPSLRKAAVLVSALDERTAEAILSQMGTEDAAKVRSAIVELEHIPADEQQRVLAEFLRQQGAQAVPSELESGGVELELDSVIEERASALPQLPTPTIPLPESGASFEFLEHVESSALATILSHEHPQVVAVVLAQLSPSHAAALLEQLPAELATEALERTALLDELSPEIKSDLARGLRQQLLPYLRASEAGPAHLVRVNAVLEAMDQRQRQHAVKQLAERNTALSRRLGIAQTRARTSESSKSGDVVAFRYRLDSTVERAETARVEAARTKARTQVSEESGIRFEDIAVLNDSALRAVFAESEAEVVLLALTGAEPRLINRILSRMPAQDAKVLRQRLDQPGPIRLNDIDQAREELLRTANRLAREGQLSGASTSRFYAAV